MTDGPHSAADAERFYKTLQCFAFAALDNPAGPWTALPNVEAEHRDVIDKIISWTPEHRDEVAAYLRKAVSLVGQRKQPQLMLVHSASPSSEGLS